MCGFARGRRRASNGRSRGMRKRAEGVQRPFDGGSRALGGRPTGRWTACANVERVSNRPLDRVWSAQRRSPRRAKGLCSTHTLRPTGRSAYALHRRFEVRFEESVQHPHASPRRTKGVCTAHTLRLAGRRVYALPTPSAPPFEGFGQRERASAAYAGLAYAETADATLLRLRRMPRDASPHRPMPLLKSLTKSPT
jgi:hypothetical protein